MPGTPGGPPTGIRPRPLPRMPIAPRPEKPKRKIEVKFRSRKEIFNNYKARSAFLAADR